MSRSTSSSSTWLGEPIRCIHHTPYATTSSIWVVLGCDSRVCSCFGLVGGKNGLLLLVNMRPSVDTRFGYLAAKICAIIPPIDAPTTYTLLSANLSSKRRVSSTMSNKLYATGKWRFVKPTCIRSIILTLLMGKRGKGRAIFEDSPISRLSKRITKKPASIKPLTKLSGQNTNCEPKPMISSKGGWSGLPPTSTHSCNSSPISIMALCIKSVITEGSKLNLAKSIIYSKNINLLVGCWMNLPH